MRSRTKMLMACIGTLLLMGCQEIPTESMAKEDSPTTPTPNFELSGTYRTGSTVAFAGSFYPAVCTHPGTCNSTLPGFPIAGGGQMLSVEAADLNGDRKVDLLFGVSRGNGYVCQGDGAGWIVGNCVVAPYLTDTDRLVNDIEAADFTGDGLPELVVANERFFAANPSQYCENTTSVGAWPPTFNCSTPSVFGEAERVEVADTDGDGRADAVYFNRGALFPTLHQVFTYSSGVFAAAAGQPAVAGTDVAVGDLDGVNGLDIVISRYGSTDQVCLNTGAGSYTCSGLPPATDQTTNLSQSVEVGDFNGDNRLDIVVGMQDPFIKLCLNSGTTPRFPSCSALPAPGGNRDVDVAYVDANNTLDLVVSNFTAGANRICLNGAGGFTCEAVPATGTLNTTAMDAVVFAEARSCTGFSAGNVRDVVAMYPGDNVRIEFDALPTGTPPFTFNFDLNGAFWGHLFDGVARQVNFPVQNSIDVRQVDPANNATWPYVRVDAATLTQVGKDLLSAGSSLNTRYDLKVTDANGCTSGPGYDDAVLVRINPAPTETVFAWAYSDLNGVNGYQPTGTGTTGVPDVLIAKWVDGPLGAADGKVGPGDYVVPNKYPNTHDIAALPGISVTDFGNYSIQSGPLARAVFMPSGQGLRGWRYTPAAFPVFTFGRDALVESYDENGGGANNSTFIDHFTAADFLEVALTSPSGPDIAVTAVSVFPGVAGTTPVQDPARLGVRNHNFLDVDINYAVLDQDGDLIYNEVDPNPNTAGGNAFQRQIPAGLASGTLAHAGGSGTRTSRIFPGPQANSIGFYFEAATGVTTTVNLTCPAGTSSLPGLGKFTIPPQGAYGWWACGSVIVSVEEGEVTAEFTAEDGTVVTTTLTGGFGATFDEETGTLEADPDNPGPLAAEINGVPVVIEKGGTIIVQAHATTLTYDGATSGQYSDVSKLCATLTDNDASAPGYVAGKMITFYWDGATVGTGTTNSSGRACTDLATNVYTVTNPNGGYTVKASFAGDLAYHADDTDNIDFDVDAEDASVTPGAGNQNAYQVGTPGGLASFSLMFTVMEKYGPEPDQNDKALAGDIGMANLGVSLVPVGGGSAVNPVSCLSPVSGTGYGSTKTYTCSFSGVLVETYEVRADLNGTYYAGGYSDVVTVFDPSLGFVTGGGTYLMDGDRVNFGFVAKVVQNKKNSVIKGSLLVVRHKSNGDIARIKSNVFDGLAVGTNSAAGTATFSGKANYMTVMNGVTATDPVNYDFTAFVKDGGTPGAGVDQFSLYHRKGDAASGYEVRTSLSLAALKTSVKTLTGGNIQVPQPQGK